MSKDKFIHIAGPEPGWPLEYFSEGYDPLLVCMVALGEIPPLIAAAYFEGAKPLRGGSNFPISVDRDEPTDPHKDFPPMVRNMVSEMQGVDFPQAVNGLFPETSVILPKTLKDSKGKRDVFIDAPASPIIKLLADHSDLAKEKISRIHMMGGVLPTKEVRGNLGDFNPIRLGFGMLGIRIPDFSGTEINFNYHVPKIMFESGIPITLYTLNATHNLLLNDRIHERLTRKTTDPKLSLISAYIDKLYKTTKRFRQKMPLWNIGALLAMQHPEIASDPVKRNLAINSKGKISESRDGAEIDMVDHIDQELFEQTLFRSLGV